MDISPHCATKDNSDYGKDPMEIELLAEILCEMGTIKKRRIVILIDEYDHPTLSNSGNPEGSKHVLNFMGSLFLEMKRSGSSIYFAFVTGITNLARPLRWLFKRNPRRYHKRWGVWRAGRCDEGGVENSLCRSHQKNC